MFRFVSEAIGEPVGFTAYATTEQSYSDNDIVIFDGIITNIGGHYNKDSSSFICPYSAVYMFSINYVSRYDTYTGKRMVLQKMFKAKTVKNSKPNHAQDMCS